MNDRFLEEKIDAIRLHPHCAECAIDEETLLRFSRALVTGRGWELIRINPFAFAEKHDFPPNDAVHLFLLGAQAGLFVFEWSLVCPACGLRERTYRSLHELEGDAYRCSLCGMEATVRADDRLEAAFTMPPGLSGKWPDTAVSLHEYLTYSFAASGGAVEEMNGPFPADSAVRQPPIRFAVLMPGKTVRLRCDRAFGRTLRLESLETHSVAAVIRKDDAKLPPLPACLELSASGFNKTKVFITDAHADIRLCSTCSRPTGVIIGAPKNEVFLSLPASYPSVTQPFCSAKFLFNCQLFHDLLRADDLPSGLSMPLADLTFLCTAPAGAEEAVPSPPSFNDVVKAVIRAHRGAVIGNEHGRLTATFNGPLDGVRAAVYLLDEFAGRSPRNAADGTNALKMSLHRGPAVAINAGGALDYFGRTPRIASRLQDLAQPGEMLLTEDVMREEAVAAFLRRAGFSAVVREASLPGTAERCNVFSCKR